jgi:hypothetical protein
MRISVAVKSIMLTSIVGMSLTTLSVSAEGNAASAAAAASSAPATTSSPAPEAAAPAAIAPSTAAPAASAPAVDAPAKDVKKKDMGDITTLSPDAKDKKINEASKPSDPAAKPTADMTKPADAIKSADEATKPATTSTNTAPTNPAAAPTANAAATATPGEANAMPKQETASSNDSQATGVNSETIVSFAKDAALSAFTYDYKTYDDSLKKTSSYFTKEGWAEFQKALAASKNLDTVKKEQLAVNAELDGPAILQKQEVIAGGGKVWRVDVPIKVSYSGNNNQLSQRLVVHLGIVPVANEVNKSGVAITQFVTLPA